MLWFVPALSLIQLGGPPTVVRVSPSAVSAAPEWKIGPPVLRIGENPSDESTQLHNAGLPVRLGDGRIAVPNDQKEIRYFSPEGKFLRSAGQRGQGPGDFRQLWAIYAVADDSIVAFDSYRDANQVSRFSVFGPDGRYVRAFQQRASPDAAMLPDRTMPRLASDRKRHIDALNSNFVGVLVDTSLVVRTRPNDVTDTLMRIPASPSRYLGGGNWGGELNLTASPYVAAGGGGIVAAFGGSFDLYWFDADGKPLRTISVGMPVTRVSEQMKQRVQAIRAKTAASRPRLRSEAGPGRLEPMYMPTLPVISRLRMDRLGRLWVRRWVFDDEPVAEWIVFTSAGNPVARVKFPTTFTFHDAGADWVLGRYTDEDGVQSVRMYRYGT